MSIAATLPPKQEQVFYVYRVTGHGRSQSGVTHNLHEAGRGLVAGMHAIPEAVEGAVHLVRLVPSVHPCPDYRYGRVLVHAWRDQVTGALVVQEGA